MDIDGIRKLWAHVSPHLHQPKDNSEVTITLHSARARCEAVPLKLRAYSHRWLLDHGYPSGLPDRLKPKAERLYPKVVTAVGIAVKASSALISPIVPLIRGSMETAVLDAYADNRTQPEFVKARMTEAREKTVKQLLGI